MGCAGSKGMGIAASLWVNVAAVRGRTRIVAVRTIRLELDSTEVRYSVLRIQGYLPVPRTGGQHKQMVWGLLEGWVGDA